MASVDIRINGRPYTVACDDGEEDHVAELAGYVNQRVMDLVSKLGQVGDARLLVLASLLIADELGEAYGALEQAREGGTPAPIPMPAADAAAADQLAGALESLAERVETIAARLAAT